ncbi:hypothetical protein H2201_008301 [Coniosporium apollinis]|uniref:SAP domain-containing protein n=1 Tax=Coniosporium apollinis TaxID=61459 RepID=A0ABQ9NGI0_9PEZI|nr:hypothetical protein H2201_008301 [Coniosporium apollinis]
MSAFAPPISRDGFLYHDTFYADVGNLNRHPRASVAELTVLLRPELSTNKKSNNSVIKDQVGHWYEAQLRHYGLPPTKDKNAAKVRLLGALNTGKLEVPKYVERLEEELRKEYAVENRRAKAAAKGAGVPGGGEGSGKSGGAGQKRKQAEAAVGDVSATTKKRKQSDAPAGAASVTTKKTKVTVMVGDIAVNIEEAVTAKKQTASRKSTATEKKPAAKKATGQKAESASKSKAAVTDLGPMSAEYFQAAPAPKERSKQTARRSMPFNRTPLTSRPAPESPEPPASPQTSMPKQTARRGTHTSVASKRKPKQDEPAPFAVHPLDPPSKKVPAKVKKEAAVKKEPTAKKPKPTIKNEDPDDPIPPPNPDSSIAVSGVYTMACPSIAAGWPSHISHLRFLLQVDHETDTIWGSYDLGPFSGVIRIPTTQVTLNVSLSFGWRGREVETERLSFARSNSGEISFSGAGDIRGAIFGLYGEVLEFWGARRHGLLWSGRAAWEYEREWDAFVDEAYGR